MTDRVMIEDGRIIFRNFAGKEGPYNQEGYRNFCVLLDTPTAELMLKDGWNIKWLRAREEGEPDQAYVQVSVSYKSKPPLVVLITSKGRTTLPEDMVEAMDWVDIGKVDLIISPYQWSVNGKSGVKAYLKSLFVTMAEDELMLKYANVPELDLGGKPLELEAGPNEDDEIWEGEVVED
jgi:hypothetical protein